MRRTATTPNFRGRSAVVLHRPHPAADAVLRQLERLGIAARPAWPALAAADLAADFVLFDADTAHDGQFPWPAGTPPMPLVALIGSEAPGRLDWVLAQGATGHLLKPVASGGVFSALVIAEHGFAERRDREARIADLETRLRLRPVVVRAILTLMAQRGLNEADAFREIRSAAMQRRRSIEEHCLDLAAGTTDPAAGRRGG
jgi:AmiR/NasT family two-component response regulator